MKYRIVGGDHSFTHLAVKQRYEPDDKLIVKGSTHPALVDSIIKDGLDSDECAVVPLWNSNTGTVDMNQQNQIPELFTQEKVYISDLWPEHIEFGIHTKGTLDTSSAIYSVKVAARQCSVYLEKNGLKEKFHGFDSTTDAFDAYKADGEENDGILCSKPLLDEEGLEPLRSNPTNCYNFTIFAVFKNQLENCGCFSLGCVVVSLEGSSLPSEFHNYYQELIPLEDISSGSNVLDSVPRVLFIMRYQESRAILVMELPTDEGGESPWIPPDAESQLDFHDEIGRLDQSFLHDVESLLQERLGFAKENRSLYYGWGDCFVWACPTLNISVHGFDMELVKKCARAQVDRLAALISPSLALNIPEDARKLLEAYVDEPSSLHLSEDCMPQVPC